MASNAGGTMFQKPSVVNVSVRMFKSSPLAKSVIVWVGSKLIGTIVEVAGLRNKELSMPRKVSIVSVLFQSSANPPLLKSTIPSFPIALFQPVYTSPMLSIVNVAKLLVVRYEIKLDSSVEVVVSSPSFAYNDLFQSKLAVSENTCEESSAAESRATPVLLVISVEKNWSSKPDAPL